MEGLREVRWASGSKGEQRYRIRVCKGLVASRNRGEEEEAEEDWSLD